ncbi:hypothetical protein PLICRDRAFT_696764 [Plicaturopsis crispa FD-325 SS-3]|nr:hypothetical protein PLICRDRAFT_696764 [Plicaturopsis crispa FD-325 SS-3]
MSTQVTISLEELNPPVISCNANSIRSSTVTVDWNLPDDISLLEMVPVEIWSAIFVCCLDSTLARNPNPNNAPVLLCHVCRLWRVIALSTPSLWSSIDDTEYEGHTWGIRKGWIQSWLDRSGACPLTIATVVEVRKVTPRPERGLLEVDIEPVKPLLQDFFTLVLPHSQRWKRLSVDVLNITDSPPPFVVPRDVPLLEHISIINRSGCHILHWFYPMVHAATQLNSFVLRDYPRPPESSDLHLSFRDFIGMVPWAQLTCLTLHTAYRIDIVFSILAQCVKLRECRLSLEPSNQISSPRPLQIDLPELTHISVNAAGRDLVRVWQCLNVPALPSCVFGHLGFHNALSDMWPAAMAEFRSLLSRSQCYLVRLTLSNIVVTPEQLIEFLQDPRISRSLAYLGIRLCVKADRFITDEVLHLLTYSDQPTPQAGYFASNLEEIILDGCVASTDGVLADMVMSRCRRNVELDGTERPARLKRVCARPRFIRFSRSRGRDVAKENRNHVADAERLAQLEKDEGIEAAWLPTKAKNWIP